MRFSLVKLPQLSRYYLTIQWHGLHLRPEIRVEPRSVYLSSKSLMDLVTILTSGDSLLLNKSTPLHLNDNLVTILPQPSQDKEITSKSTPTVLRSLPISKKFIYDKKSTTAASTTVNNDLSLGPKLDEKFNQLSQDVKHIVPIYEYKLLQFDSHVDSTSVSIQHYEPGHVIISIDIDDSQHISQLLADQYRIGAFPLLTPFETDSRYFLPHYDTYLMKYYNNNNNNNKIQNNNLTQNTTNALIPDIHDASASTQPDASASTIHISNNNNNIITVDNTKPFPQKQYTRSNSFDVMSFGTITLRSLSLHISQNLLNTSKKQKIYPSILFSSILLFQSLSSTNQQLLYDYSLSLSTSLSSTSVSLPQSSLSFQNSNESLLYTWITNNRPYLSSITTPMRIFSLPSLEWEDECDTWFCHNEELSITQQKRDKIILYPSYVFINSTSIIIHPYACIPIQIASYWGNFIQNNDNCSDNNDCIDSTNSLSSLSSPLQTLHLPPCIFTMNDKKYDDLTIQNTDISLISRDNDILQLVDSFHALNLDSLHVTQSQPIIFQTNAQIIISKDILEKNILLLFQHWTTQKIQHDSSVSPSTQSTSPSTPLSPPSSFIPVQIDATTNKPKAIPFNYDFNFDFSPSVPIQLSSIAFYSILHDIFVLPEFSTTTEESSSVSPATIKSVTQIYAPLPSLYDPIFIYLINMIKKTPQSQKNTISFPLHSVRLLMCISSVLYNIIPSTQQPLWLHWWVKHSSFIIQHFFPLLCSKPLQKTSQHKINNISTQPYNATVPITIKQATSDQTAAMPSVGSAAISLSLSARLQSGLSKYDDELHEIEKNEYTNDCILELLSEKTLLLLYYSLYFVVKYQDFTHKSSNNSYFDKNASKPCDIYVKITTFISTFFSYLFHQIFHVELTNSISFEKWIISAQSTLFSSYIPTSVTSPTPNSLNSFVTTSESSLFGDFFLSSPIAYTTEPSSTSASSSSLLPTTTKPKLKSSSLLTLSSLNKLSIPPLITHQESSSFVKTWPYLQKETPIAYEVAKTWEIYPIIPTLNIFQQYTFETIYVAHILNMTSKLLCNKLFIYNESRTIGIYLHIQHLSMYTSQHVLYEGREYLMDNTNSSIVLQNQNQYEEKKLIHQKQQPIQCSPCIQVGYHIFSNQNILTLDTSGHITQILHPLLSLLDPQLTTTLQTSQSQTISSHMMSILHQTTTVIPDLSVICEHIKQLQTISQLPPPLSSEKHQNIKQRDKKINNKKSSQRAILELCWNDSNLALFILLLTYRHAMVLEKPSNIAAIKTKELLQKIQPKKDNDFNLDKLLQDLYIAYLYRIQHPDYRDNH